MSSSLKSAHCKERQLERGISDSDIDRAIEHGAIQPGSGKRRRVHTGGGVTAVIATDTNVAVTAWRSDETCHHEDGESAVVVHRICEYGESSASDADGDENEEDREERQVTKYFGQAWNTRPSRRFWSCCNKRVQAAGEEDGCKECAGVDGLAGAGGRAAREAVYSERSKVLKFNSEERASYPDCVKADGSDPYLRPWDNSIGDDASPDCNCGYADGVYSYCICVGECTRDDDDEGDDEDNDDEGDDEEDGSEDSDNFIIEDVRHC